jgi:predicted CXXCH cytochrome family protein
MKRFKLLAMATLGTVLTAVAVTAWSTPASANGGPHGGYTLTTSACAGCHRAHTAIGPMQLRETSVYELCTTCHDGTISTDVIHGRLNGAGMLNGGGFESVNGTLVTSAHNVEGLGGGNGIGRAWGSQNGDRTPVADAGLGVTGTLECTSCHNPHGSTNYRILNDAGTESNKWVASDPDLLLWVNYQVIATRDDAPNYGFVTDLSNCPAIPVTGTTPTPTAGPGTKCMARYTSGVYSGSGKTAVPDFTKGMNAFCATCHKGYLTGSGAYAWNSLGTPVLATPPTAGTATWVAGYPVFYPGKQDANDGHGNVERFRHSVDRTKGSAPKLPLRFAARGTDPNPAGSLTYDVMGCLTCHFAHGSAAARSGAAAGVAPTNDSALLFYDNRGVCISCHLTVGAPATLTPTALPPTATATPVP